MSTSTRVLKIGEQYCTDSGIVIEVTRKTDTYVYYEIIKTHEGRDIPKARRVEGKLKLDLQVPISLLEKVL